MAGTLEALEGPEVEPEVEEVRVGDETNVERKLSHGLPLGMPRYVSTKELAPPSSRYVQSG